MRWSAAGRSEVAQGVVDATASLPLRHDPIQHARHSGKAGIHFQGQTLFGAEKLREIEPHARGLREP